MTGFFTLEAAVVDRAGRRVLNGASLTVAAGDRIAIAGPNGAGKTTLLRTLVGLENLSAGRLSAFGRERTGERDFREVRLKTGFLFQDPDDQLFAPTVIEDVMFGPLNQGLTPAAARTVAVAALERVGVGSLADRIIGHLSGGEKRMVALAGVLAMAPEVVLLDEPTNDLDEAHRDALIALITGLPQALVVVSHDRLFLEAVTSRAVVLEAGRLRPATLHRHRHVHDHVHIHPVEP